MAKKNEQSAAEKQADKQEQAAPQPTPDRAAPAGNRAESQQEAADPVIRVGSDTDTRGDQPVTTLTSVLVTIERDQMMKVAKRVFEHEIPILEQLHGEDMVSVEDGSERDVKVAMTAEEEYDRLCRRYGKKGEQAVHFVYGSQSGKLASETGLPGKTKAKARTGRHAAKRSQSVQKTPKA